MQNVVCFAIGTKNYVNPMRISIGSFCAYNNSKLIVYLTDNSADYFNQEFHYNNVEFINIGKTKSREYFDKNRSNLAKSCYVFTDDHLFDIFVANELLDRTIAEYKNDTKAILRLDLDTVFTSSIDDSVNNFLESGCIVGSSIENSIMRPMWCAGVIPDSVSVIDNYMNMGNFILKITRDVITDHYKRSLQIYETYGLNKLYFPDQDAINLIYKNYNHYNMNKDGWLISMADINDYYEVDKPVFIHYAGLDKPFVRKENLIYPCFKSTYKWYRNQAIKYHCDNEFIAAIDQVILDTSNHYSFVNNGAAYYGVLMYQKFKKWGLT